MPFGFGLFAVEDSAGDDVSMNVKERVEREMVGVETKEDGWEDR